MGEKKSIEEELLEEWNRMNYVTRDDEEVDPAFIALARVLERRLEGAQPITATLESFGNPEAEQRRIVRALLAGQMMAKLKDGENVEKFAEQSVKAADALLAELDRTEKPEPVVDDWEPNPRNPNEQMAAAIRDAFTWSGTDGSK